MRINLFFLISLLAVLTNSVPAWAEEPAAAIEQKDIATAVETVSAEEDKTETEASPAADQASEAPESDAGEVKEAALASEETEESPVQDPVGPQESLTDETVTGADSTVSDEEIPADSAEGKDESSQQKQEVKPAPEQTGSVEEKKQRISQPIARRTKQSDLKTISGHFNRLNHLNRKVTEIEDETDIKKLLDDENQELSRLMALLKTTNVDKLPSPVNRKEMEFLTSRIEINQARGNKLAVQRDQFKLAYFKVIQGINDYIEFLIQSSRNFEGIDEIISKSVETRTAFEQISKEVSLPEDDLTSSVGQALEKNYLEFKIAEDTFNDILTFVINNPGMIASTHWFQKFTLLSAISFVNSFDFIKPVNFKLSPFRVDAGGILVSLLIFSLVFLTYPVFFKFSSWVVESYILDKSSESAELIYHELRKPIRFLIVFIGIDLATYSLLYKAKYRFDDLAFIIYAMIFVWFLYKVLDSVVIAHFERVSKTNKDLRRDLVKLSIQLVKGIIMIIALAVILNHFNINITALMSTLGIGGVAFAFAAKDTISNLFGGITILFDNMFKMGDWVIIGDVEGTVAEIGLRSTTIRTFDNALVTVPNSQISVSSVVNWNRRAVGRRIKMYVGVTYESNMEDIRNALQDIRTMLTEHPGIASPKQKLANKRRQFRLSSHEDTQGIKSTQLVFMDRYNDYSIDILIYCFSRTVNWAEWLEVKEDVLFKIAEILEKNHLEFAYPTQVRIHRQDEVEGGLPEGRGGVLDAGTVS